MFDRMFPLFFGTIFVMVLLTFASAAFLGAQCYFSNDPNSMACYMMSDRVDIGVRSR